jgi:magnesium-protoporphyrin O-methyltransferase
MTSCHCCAADQQFDRRQAESDLKRLHRHGPDATTTQLLTAIRHHTLPAAPTLLDIGGGIGTIHHTLLDHGFAQATQVDASRAYLAIAADEADRLGHSPRVTLTHADFRTAADATAPADVVTLDRVVCCDPDYAGLLGAAADHARRLLAYSFPHRRWYTRLFVAVINSWRRVRRRAFRAYIHPPDAMTRLLESRGLRRCWRGGNWIWRVELFERTPVTP